MDSEILISDQALRLGGFVLAHGAWSISDAPDGELLVPLIVVEKQGERRLRRFEAETQEEAVAAAESAIERLGDDVEAWAFVREGRLESELETLDALLVDAWAEGMEESFTILQTYTPPSESDDFRLSGSVDVVIGEATVEDGAIAPLAAEIDRGINDHPVAAPLWNAWYETIKR